MDNYNLGMLISAKKEREFSDGARHSERMELERKIQTGISLTDDERDLLLSLIWQEQRQMLAVLVNGERQNKTFSSEATKEEEVWKSRSIRMQDRLDAAEDKIKALRSEIDEYKEVISKQKEEIRKQKEIIANIFTLRNKSNDKANELTKELDYKNTEIRCKRKELEQIRYEYEQIRQEYDQLQRKYEEIRQECDQKKKEALSLEEKLEEYHKILAEREHYDMGVE